MHTNIIKFEPMDEMLLSLDTETLELLDDLAARDAKTRDEIIAEALDTFLSDCEIGDRLLSFLHDQRKLPPRWKSRWNPIDIWEERIRQIKCELTEHTSPTPDKAA